MQPVDPHRPPRLSPRAPVASPPLAHEVPFAEPRLAADHDAAPAVAALRLAAPALLVSARFRGLTLASRLLRADRTEAFTIGNARGTDAPVNPAWLPEAGTSSTACRHVLAASAPGGFVVSLTAAMRPRLHTELHALPLTPNHGRAEIPLALPPGSTLHVPCGEVSFELAPCEPTAMVPAPWLPTRWREGVKYPLAVAGALAALLLVASFVPDDPRALSLDSFDASARMARIMMIPPEQNAPAIEHAQAVRSDGGGAPSAATPPGRSGDRSIARNIDRRTTTRGTTPRDARAAAAQIHDQTLLAVLDGPRTRALADLLADTPAMGSDAREIIGTLSATAIGSAYDTGGLAALGTGRGGADEGKPTLGGGGMLATRGKFGSGGGPSYGWGSDVGALRAHHPRLPDILIGHASVRGALDKEIIRRIVRRHLNEVKYCYEQALVAQPALAGRVVTQFTIAPTGRVLAALVESSSLHTPAVESCLVNAVRRWAFPAPEGGGLVMVSYPFSFAPAGN